MSGVFDALRAAREMEAAGIEGSHAEAIAAQLQDAAHAKQEVWSTIAELRATEAAQRAVAPMETRMTWRIVGLMIVTNAALVAAVKLIP